MTLEVQNFYDSSYGLFKIKAQRRYPNEELCRFIGRNFTNATKNCGRALEVGCGSCSNLWMLAHEGFDTYGIDISTEGIAIGRQVLDAWGVSAHLTVGNMMSLPYEDNFFATVIDVFSVYCLGWNDSLKCLSEIARTLKSGGKFFFYTPSTKCDVFLYSNNEKSDEYTLLGLTDKTFSAFLGNNYPFRFWPYEDTAEILKKFGLRLMECERISRTYNNGKEYFEFISASAIKL